MRHYILAAVTGLLITICSCTPDKSIKSPVPLLPVPSQQQLAWQQKELLMFMHFGIKTFYPSDNHMGSGAEDPGKFNPQKLDANQWLEAARAGGFKGVILTAKHHDGFCNWQTQTTDFSVKSSPWQNGKGDVVKELADACHQSGMWLGLYLSAYDVHYQNSTLDKKEYSRYYETQLTELCSNYGAIDELWFDGFGAEGMTVNWQNVAAIIQKLQPQAVIFNNLVPNMPQSCVRWPGNEQGDAGEPNWSVQPAPDSNLTVLETATWFPGEADAIAQGNWFWTGQPICSLADLQKIYLTSVGRNGVGLINVPPNQDGLIDEASVVRLKEFSDWVTALYTRDAAYGQTVTASSVRQNEPQFAPALAVDKDFSTYYWPADSVTTATMEIDLGKPVNIEAVIVQEYIPLGQRVAEHTIEYWNGSNWIQAVAGTTIGYKRIHQVTATAQRVRLVISKSRACPLISTLQVIAAAEEI